MTDDMTAMQKTAQRMGALFERHEPEPEHDCPTCGKAHSAGARTEPWYSFKIDAIRAKGADFEAIDGVMDEAAPDNEAAYDWTVEVLDAIEDGSITDEDDISEWADSATPVYTSTLLDWFAQGTNRLELIQNMVEEYGDIKDVGGAMLMQAYCYGLDRYARAVWQAVSERADAEEDGEEAAE